MILIFFRFAEFFSWSLYSEFFFPKLEVLLGLHSFFSLPLESFSEKFSFFKELIFFGTDFSFWT